MEVPALKFSALVEGLRFRRSQISEVSDFGGLR